MMIRAAMKSLEKELDELVNFASNGGGFGGQDAVEQHQREIDLLKFKITRRDNMKIAIVSASIGGVVAALVTTFTSAIG